jgi:nicotinamidase-related amidase
VSLAVDGLMKRGYEVILVSDAVKSLNQESFNKKLDEWKKSQTFRYLSVNNITQTLVV